MRTRQQTPVIKRNRRKKTIIEINFQSEYTAFISVSTIPIHNHNVLNIVISVKEIHVHNKLPGIQRIKLSMNGRGKSTQWQTFAADCLLCCPAPCVNKFIILHSVKSIFNPMFNKIKITTEKSHVGFKWIHQMLQFGWVGLDWAWNKRSKCIFLWWCS